LAERADTGRTLSVCSETRTAEMCRKYLHWRQAPWRNITHAKKKLVLRYVTFLSTCSTGQKCGRR